MRFTPLIAGMIASLPCQPQRKQETRFQLSARQLSIRFQRSPPKNSVNQAVLKHRLLNPLELAAA